MKEDGGDDERRTPSSSLWKILPPATSPRWAPRAAAVPGGPDPSEFELKSFLCESPPASKRIWGNWKVEAVEGGARRDQEEKHKLQTKAETKGDEAQSRN